MNSQDLRREVEALERESASMLDRLDALVAATRPELGSETRAWIAREVSRTIDEQATAVRALGRDRVGALKAAVTALRGRTGELVEAATSNRNRWPHRAPLPTVEDPAGLGESYFVAAFRAVISNLGAILDKHGLSGAPPGHARCWERVGNGTVRYVSDPGFDAGRSALIAEYVALHTRYRATERELAEKRDALDRARARELWNSA